MRNLFAKYLSALLIAALLLSPVALMEEAGDILPEAVDTAVGQENAELGEDVPAEPEAVFEAAAEAGAVIVFPDPIFNKYVYDNFDLDNDGALSQEEIDWVEDIDVIDMGITDLTGIETFRNLKRLQCGSNALTALNLSGNPKLQTVYCGFNTIATLTTGALPELTELYCNNNALTSLEVGSCPALVELTCCENALTALDVSNCPNLKELGCYDNKLAALDVSKNTQLTHLWCEGNEFTTLDITACASVIGFVDPAHFDIYPNGDREAMIFYRTDEYDTALSCDLGTKIIGGNPASDELLANMIVATKEGKKKIKIVNNKKVKIELGANHLIYLEGYVANSFKSSKPAVATVDAYGVITPVADGKTNITYKVGKKKYTLKLTVIDRTIPTAVYLDQTSVKAQKGTVVTLTASTPEGTDAGGYKWSSSNKKVATVDENGNVTCKKAGKATITCTANRGKKKVKAKIKVTK